VQRKKPKITHRPKTRVWFPRQGPTWLKLEPAPLAIIGGLFFSTCTMILYLVRLLLGHEVEPQSIVVATATTFLVSYGGTGFFVWYLLRVAETELDTPARKRQSGHEVHDYHQESTDGPPEAAPPEDIP